MSNEWYFPSEQTDLVPFPFGHISRQDLPTKLKGHNQVGQATSCKEI